MKTIKPQKLSVLHRTIEHGERNIFVPTILAMFPFECPDVFLHEVKLWKVATGAMGRDTVLDECMPKTKSELLVYGEAFPPGDEPKPVCRVRVRLGAVDKALYVVGDREWRNGVATKPKPFTRIPVAWSKSFGGEGFDGNPYGKGACAVAQLGTGKTHHPLPNVEAPNTLVKAPGDRPEPVCFGAMPITWPQRFARSGTYDEKWRKERAPGYPEDFDWTTFNTAPRDQWFESRFAGGEPFLVENMHESEPTLQSRLPRVRARCFVTFDQEGEEDEFREVSMHMETVQLFPNEKVGIVVFRGATPVREDDAADIKQLLVGAEMVGDGREVAHYRTVLKQRLDRKKGHLFVLRDSDLMPRNVGPVPSFDDDPVEEMRELVKLDHFAQSNARRGMEKTLEEARGELRKQGIDPDEHLPSELPPIDEEPELEELVNYFEEKETLKEEVDAKVAGEREEMEAKLRAKCIEAGIDYDEELAKAQVASAGPPKFSADDEFQKIVDQVELGRNAGMPIEDAEAKIRNPAFYRQLMDAEKSQLETYRKFAHHFPAACSRGEEGAVALRKEVERAVAAGESLAGRDLTGADLRGMNFRGVNMTGVFLEAANLEGSDFTGAKLNDAVLARAKLSDACFLQAEVERINLGEATLLRTDLSGGLNLSEAVFSSARLVETNLSDALLDRANFLDAELKNSTLDRIDARGVQFLRTGDDLLDKGLNFGGSSMRGASFEKCIFLKSDLSGCDLSNTTFRESTFYGANLDGAIFDGADCVQIGVVQGSSMRGASFRGTNLTKANLRCVPLNECDFSGAELAFANLSETDLRDATLYRINAPGAQLMKANLENANFTAANLKEAILQKSNIKGACFRGANLFRADLAKVDGNVNTDFDDANVNFIRFVERKHG